MFDLVLTTPLYSLKNAEEHSIKGESNGLNFVNIVTKIKLVIEI